MTGKIVIIGAGHGAGQLCHSLVQAGYSGTITLIGEESYPPYQRPPLSKKYLLDELEVERLFLRPETFYSENDIVCHFQERVVEVNREQNTVVTDQGRIVDYDRLVFATGARPRMLSVSDDVASSVHYIRSIDDVQNLRTQVEIGIKVLIVGAGYIGLETAAVLKKMGCLPTVVEAGSRVLARVTSPTVSNFFEDLHRTNGVELICDSGTNEMSRLDNGKICVSLTDGQEKIVDFVIVGIGAIPNTEIAEQSGLKVENGIVVDEYCQTSDPDIYALGDCCRHPSVYYKTDLRLESVHNALEQAKTVAANLSGIKTAYKKVPWFWSDQYDVKLQTVGLNINCDSQMVFGDPETKKFSVAYFNNNVFQAIDAINCPADFLSGRQMLEANMQISREKLHGSSPAELYKSLKALARTRSEK